MDNLHKWLGRLRNAQKSEDAFIAEDVIRSMFKDVTDRAEAAEDKLRAVEGFVKRKKVRIRSCGFAAELEALIKDQEDE